MIRPNGENGLSLWASTAPCWPSESLDTCQDFWNKAQSSCFLVDFLRSLFENPNFAASIPNNPITQGSEYLEESRDPA